MKKGLKIGIYNNQKIDEMKDFLIEDLANKHNIKLTTIKNKTNKKKENIGYAISLNYDKTSVCGSIEKGKHILFGIKSKLIIDEKLPENIEKKIRDSTWSYTTEKKYSQD